MKKPASISSFKMKANETAHKYFKRPFSIDEMDDAEAEMCGYDTY